MVTKTFTVDWDDYEALTKRGSTIKSRLGEINPHKLSKKVREGLILDACRGIFETDTSDLYQDLNLSLDRRFYVYSHMNSSWKIWPGYSGRLTFAATLGITHSPFYFGKGTGDRAFNMSRNGYHRKLRERFEPDGSNIMSQIVINGLTEHEAYSIEDKLIDIFRLKVYGGFLSNLDEGHKIEERRKRYQLHYDQLIMLSNRQARDRRLHPTARDSINTMDSTNRYRSRCFK